MTFWSMFVSGGSTVLAFVSIQNKHIQAPHVLTMFFSCLKLFKTSFLGNFCKVETSSSSDFPPFYCNKKNQVVAPRSNLSSTSTLDETRQKSCVKFFGSEGFLSKILGVSLSLMTYPETLTAIDKSLKSPSFCWAHHLVNKSKIHVHSGIN